MRPIARFARRLVPLGNALAMLAASPGAPESIAAPAGLPLALLAQGDAGATAGARVSLRSCPAAPAPSRLC